MTHRAETVTVSIPYGDAEMRFSLPARNLLAVAEPPPVAPAPDPEAAILRALRAPVDRPPLRELPKPGQRAVVVIDDLTRPTPTAQILPPLLSELCAGASDLDVTLLIATGTHRAMTPAEIERKVGVEVARAYRVVNHCAWDEANLVDLGRTVNGTPIRVNRLVVEADLVVGVSNVVPHCLAGWSGGAKLIQPGVCGEDTTAMTHQLNMITNIPHLGRLQNPMRREIEAVVERVRFDFSVNVVVDPQWRIVHVAAGAPKAAHEAAVALAEPVWVVPIPALADIVVVSSSPADIDYWQAIKGLFCAEMAVRRGGDIILVSPCPEGISPHAGHRESFYALAGLPSKERCRMTLAGEVEDPIGAATAVCSERINELAWVSVYSDGLSDADLRALGHARAESVPAALERAFARQGPDAKVVVIPHGGEVAPRAL